MKPQTFSGNEDWESFIGHFEVCSRLGQWSQRTKALTLLACMRGQAPNISITFTRGGTGLLFHIS